MKKLKIISLAVLAFSLHSCRKDYLYVAPVVPPPASVSWATDVFPVVKARGCGCHNSGSTPPKFSDAAAAFTALQGNSVISGLPFINTANPSASVFYAALIPSYGVDQMPKGTATKLTLNEQATVLAWITQGAHNN